MKKSLLAAPLFVVLACSNSPDRPIVGFSFDADDNLFNLPTQIMLTDVTTGEEVGVSTSRFALIKENLAAENLKFTDQSLRFFGDEIGDGQNHFLLDLERAMADSSRDWRAPAFDGFVGAMLSPKTAVQTTIITARSHEPETILAALLYLKNRDYFDRVPPTQNIWTVTNPRFEERFEAAFGKAPPTGDGTKPAPRKAAIMAELLDDIEAQPIEGKIPVIRPDAQAVGETGNYHLWGFSDDDFGNFEAAQKTIQAGLDAGRWPHIKVTLYFTGLNNRVQKPRAVVLRAYAEPRPIFAEETDEWQRLILD